MSLKTWHIFLDSKDRMIVLMMIFCSAAFHSAESGADPRPSQSVNHSEDSKPIC